MDAFDPPKKDEDDDEEGMIMNVKDDEESDNEIIMHSAKPKSIPLFFIFSFFFQSLPFL